jgi:hypothetical protein
MTMKNEIVEFLERALRLSDAEPQPQDDVARMRLASMLRTKQADSSAAAIAPEIWGAYLEGRLDPEQRALVQRQMAASPELAQEAASIVELLEAVAAHPATIPADLAAEVAGLSYQAFAAAPQAGSRGLRKLFESVTPQGASAGGLGLRGVLEIVWGEGRQACEILIHSAADFIGPAAGAWSFAPAPAMVTRSGQSGGPAMVEGVRDEDSAGTTVTADRFEGTRHLEIVVRELPDGAAPVILVSTDGDESPPVRLEPTVIADSGSGTFRLRYEFEELPPGRCVVGFCAPATPEGTNE